MHYLTTQSVTVSKLPCKQRFLNFLVEDGRFLATVFVTFDLFLSQLSIQSMKVIALRFMRFCFRPIAMYEYDSVLKHLTIASNYPV